MKINNIKIQNFYSFKDSSVDFSKCDGITVIKGRNKDAGGSNGAGKSVFVEAVYFALTRKPIRKSTEDTLINNQAKRKCKVEIELSNGLKIIRQKKPTKLEFFLNGENLTQESVIATQKLIDKTLNTNHKVLMASMFFGQSNDLNFLDCSADDKRVIIRNFLNLEEIFEMRDRIKSHKSKFYQTIKQQDAIITEHLSTLDSIDAKIADVEEAKKKYKRYDTEILQMSLSDILNIEEEENKRQSSLSGLVREMHTNSLHLEKLRYRHDNPNKERVCEACNQKVVNQEDVSLLSKEIDEVTKYLSSVSEDVHRVTEDQVPIPISSREFQEVLAYKDLCRDETNYTGIKDEIKDKISLSEKVKISNKTQYEVMRFWEKAFSEHGLIKHIIKNVLDFFNEKANYYLSYLSDSKYFIEFDEELTEKITTGKKVIYYISLSGGEKRKVNLAVMLALKDLLLFTDKTQCNLLFFDEVAENLDEEGVMGLYNLLQEIKKNKTVFVITHNKYLKTLLDSSPRLAIIKHRGISKVLEK